MTLRRGHAGWTRRCRHCDEPLRNEPALVDSDAPWLVFHHSCITALVVEDHIDELVEKAGSVDVKNVMARIELQREIAEVHNRLGELREQLRFADQDIGRRVRGDDRVPPPPMRRIRPQRG